LFIHLVFIYLLLKVFPPVRFYILHKVADVFIATPDKISIPRIGTEYFSGESTRGGVSEELSLDTGAKDKGGVSVSRYEERGEVFLPNISLGQERGPKEKDSSRYVSVPDFRLASAPKEKAGFSLIIPIGPEKKPGRVPDENEQMDLSLSRFASSGFSSLRFNRVDSKGNVRPRQRSREALERIGQAADFDISPWAKAVLEKIRNRWDIPPIEESRARGKARILVVIGKDGALIELEVVESSNFLLFDESAVQAIRSSAPFLPLPDDFPTGRLEIYLLFEFDE
jgi:TonB family protein